MWTRAQGSKLKSATNRIKPNEFGCFEETLSVKQVSDADPLFRKIWIFLLMWTNWVLQTAQFKYYCENRFLKQKITFNYFPLDSSSSREKTGMIQCEESRPSLLKLSGNYIFLWIFQDSRATFTAAPSSF